MRSEARGDGGGCRTHRRTGCPSRLMTLDVEARRRVCSLLGRADLGDRGRRSSSEQCTAAQQPAPTIAAR